MREQKSRCPKSQRTRNERTSPGNDPPRRALCNDLVPQIEVLAIAKRNEQVLLGGAADPGTQVSVQRRIAAADSATDQFFAIGTVDKAAGCCNCPARIVMAASYLSQLQEAGRDNAFERSKPRNQARGQLGGLRACEGLEEIRQSR